MITPWRNQHVTCKSPSLSLMSSKELTRRSAIEYASDIRFHQSFTLPPNPQAGRPAPIRVTYADADHRHDKRSDGPTILCVGGMMGGRYMVSGSMDILAKRHGVRFLCVDRCGLGGSGNVALEHRVQSWLGEPNFRADALYL